MVKNKVSLRQKTGQRAGFIGIFSNLLLFLAKIIFGVMSNSVAVIADGFNSLADCASALVSLVGFKMSSKRRDEGHPYGHGRMEYISGFVISMIIMMTAVSFGQFAISRIVNPEGITETPVLYGVLIASILVKVGLVIYYRHVNKSVDSATINATTKDSVSDVLTTSITLLSLVVAPLTSFPVDGVAGLVVVVFVLWSGGSSFWENLSLLLGESVDRQLLKSIRTIVLAYGSFKRVKSIDVHDYGPESQVAVIMVVLASDVKPKKLENDLRLVKRELQTALDIDATIYWPPLNKA